MVQGVTAYLPQTGYGYEGVSRSGASASNAGTGASRSAGTSVVKKSKDSSAEQQLTPEQQRVVQELKQTDLKVRAHEQAHVSVGADLIRGGVSFSYETGPDNKRYAVGGEVSIDTSPARTPEETIPKAQHIRATALAPSDPSTQDRRVASEASTMEFDARAEVAAQRSEEMSGAASEPKSSGAESAERDNASFYQGVAQASSGLSRVGVGVDSFA